jgi:hypothetical protein
MKIFHFVFIDWFHHLSYYFLVFLAIGQFECFPSAGNDKSFSAFSLSGR